MQGSQYTPEEIGQGLAVLDAHEGNKSRAAKALDVPRKTLSDWDARKRVPELRQSKKIELADKIDEVVWKIVNAMPDKIEKAGLKDSAIAMGTGIDKAALLRGDPTQITASTDARDVRASYLQKCLSQNIPLEQAEQLADRAFAVFEIKDESDSVS